MYVPQHRIQEVFLNFPVPKHYFYWFVVNTAAPSIQALLPKQRDIHLYKRCFPFFISVQALLPLFLRTKWRLCKPWQQRIKSTLKNRVSVQFEASTSTCAENGTRQCTKSILEYVLPPLLKLLGFLVKLAEESSYGLASKEYAVLQNLRTSMGHGMQRWLRPTRKTKSFCHFHKKPIQRDHDVNKNTGPKGFIQRHDV